MKKLVHHSHTLHSSMQFWVQPIQDLLDDMIVAANPRVHIARLKRFLYDFELGSDCMKTAFFHAALINADFDRDYYYEPTTSVRLTEKVLWWLLQHALVENMECYFNNHANQRSSESNTTLLFECLGKLETCLEPGLALAVAKSLSVGLAGLCLRKLPWQAMSSVALVQVVVNLYSDSAQRAAVVPLLKANLPLGFACVAQAQKINLTCRKITDKLRVVLDFAIGDAFIMATVISTGAWQVPALWALSDGRSLLHILEPVLSCDPCDLTPQVAASPIAAALQRWTAPRRAWMAAVTRITSRDSAAAVATAAPAAAPACKMQRSL